MLDTVFNILKVTAIVAVSAVFLLAINAFLNFLSIIVFGNVVGEFFALLSMYLPFNAGAVFTSIGLSISAILAFLIAKKIFDLTSWSISSV